jgi:hypothetical protein
VGGLPYYARGEHFVTLGMEQGATERRPDAGLGPDIRALVIPNSKMKGVPSKNGGTKFQCIAQRRKLH